MVEVVVVVGGVVMGMAVEIRRGLGVVLLSGLLRRCLGGTGRILGGSSCRVLLPILVLNLEKREFGTGGWEGLVVVGLGL